MTPEQTKRMLALEPKLRIEQAWPVSLLALVADAVTRDALLQGLLRRAGYAEIIQRNPSGLARVYTDPEETGAVGGEGYNLLDALLSAWEALP